MGGPNVGVLRRAFASTLTETGQVVIPGGWVYNPQTDLEEQTYTVTWSGPMLVRPRFNDPQVGSDAAGSWIVTRYDVTLPADTPVKVGDILRLTTATYDASLIGVQLKVIDVPLDQWQVARLAVCSRVI